MANLTVVETGRYKTSGLDIIVGTFANSSSAGGDVVTGLSRIEFFKIQPTGAAVNTNAAVVNETLPLAGGTVTVVTDNDSETYGFVAMGSL